MRDTFLGIRFKVGVCNKSVTYHWASLLIWTSEIKKGYQGKEKSEMRLKKWAEVSQTRVDGKALLWRESERKQYAQRPRSTREKGRGARDRKGWTGDRDGMRH